MTFINDVIEFVKNLLSSLFQIWGPDGFQLGIGWSLILVLGLFGLLRMIFYKLRR